MLFREQDKHFLWALYSGIAMIFVWKGVWEGVYEIPIINDPWVFLFFGFAMLTFSGVIFNEFDPLGGVEKAVNKTAHYVYSHPHKEEFDIKYYDKVSKKSVTVNAQHLKGIEKKALVVRHPQKNQELFIPFHRLTEIIHKGKPYWRM